MADPTAVEHPMDLVVVDPNPTQEEEEEHDQPSMDPQIQDAVCQPSLAKPPSRIPLTLVCWFPSCRHLLFGVRKAAKEAKEMRSRMWGGAMGRTHCSWQHMCWKHKVISKPDDPWLRTLKSRLKNLQNFHTLRRKPEWHLEPETSRNLYYLQFVSLVVLRNLSYEILISAGCARGIILPLR